MHLRLMFFTVGATENTAFDFFNWEKSVGMGKLDMYWYKVMYLRHYSGRIAAIYWNKALEKPRKIISNYSLCLNR